MLNNNAFVVLAGNPSKWDEEIRTRCAPGGVSGTFKSEDLCSMQIDQHHRGRRSAELVTTIYGYSVRMASGIDGRAILFGGRSLGRKVSREEAIEFGKKWANESLETREFYARKTDMAVP